VFLPGANISNVAEQTSDLAGERQLGTLLGVED
jgi:hypothetical protein